MMGCRRVAHCFDGTSEPPCAGIMYELSQGSSASHGLSFRGQTKWKASLLGNRGCVPLGLCRFLPYRCKTIFSSMPQRCEVLVAFCWIKTAIASLTVHFPACDAFASFYIGTYAYLYVHMHIHYAYQFNRASEARLCHWQNVGNQQATLQVLASQT